MKTTVVINRGQMGHGDDELGARILKTFFSKAASVRGFDTMVFYNSDHHHCVFRLGQLYCGPER